MGAEPGVLIYKKKPTTERQIGPKTQGKGGQHHQTAGRMGADREGSLIPCPLHQQGLAPRGSRAGSSHAGRRWHSWRAGSPAPQWLSLKWGLGHSSLEPQSPEEEPYSGWEKGLRVGSLPELRVVISTAEVGSGMCQGPHSPSYPPASLVPSGRGPSVPKGVGMRRAGPVCGLQLQRGAGVWCSPLALTPRGGE